MLLSSVRHPLLAWRRRQVLPRWVREADAWVGRRINSRDVHPAVDRGFVRLSHAADRGILWFSCAAVLVLLGRRRAALRGVLSLTAASALANLVGKQVFGGDRPLLKDVPIGRHLPAQPTSGSFPSGHSASAAAFATGVALESRAGFAIAPAALGVAYSRLHTGAHWLSDVVGGIALGMTVAAVGKILVPAQPILPKPAGSGRAVPLAALPEGAGAFIVVNPSSGADVYHRDPLPTLAERLPKAVIRQLEGSESLDAVIRHALQSDTPPRAIGVYGGDGSVATAAHLAREAGLPLIVLPGGTFNHFARTAGVETVNDAIDAVQAGEGVRADVAELRFSGGDPVTVINTASVGLYPDFVAERERHQARVGKWAAAVLAAVRVLRDETPIDVTVNGRHARVWTVFVGVNRNDPGVVAPLQRCRLDDGVLDVRILHAGSRARAVGALSFGHRTSAVLRAIGLAPASAVERIVAPSVQVAVRPHGGQPSGLAHDGEVSISSPSGDAPRGGYLTDIRIVPQGLELYRPARAS